MQKTTKETTADMTPIAPDKKYYWMSRRTGVWLGMPDAAEWKLNRHFGGEPVYLEVYPFLQIASILNRPQPRPWQCVLALGRVIHVIYRDGGNREFMALEHFDEVI